MHDALQIRRRNSCAKNPCPYRHRAPGASEPLLRNANSIAAVKVGMFEQHTYRQRDGGNSSSECRLPHSKISLLTLSVCEVCPRKRRKVTKLRASATTLFAPMCSIYPCRTEHVSTSIQYKTANVQADVST